MDLAQLIHEIMERMDSVERWKSFTNRKYKETVLVHSYEASVLAMVMVIIESRYRKFDALAVLMTAIVHDWGEGVMGDIQWHIKNDKRVKDGLTEIEHEEVQKIMRELPEGVGDKLNKYFSLQEDLDYFEGKLFRAIELLGYVMFAWREYQGGRKSLSKYSEISIPALWNYETRCRV